MEFIPLWSPGDQKMPMSFLLKLFFKSKRGIYSQY